MKIKPIDGKMASIIVVNCIDETRFFRSVRGEKYPCRHANDAIFYIGERRNGGEEEDIRQEDFLLAFDSIKSLQNVNTISILKLVPNKIYRKRTPFIGLLLSASIIG